MYKEDADDKRDPTGAIASSQEYVRQVYPECKYFSHLLRFWKSPLH